MNSRLVIILATWAVLALLPAQQVSPGAGLPDELLQLRRTYETQALTSGKLLSEQYVNFLSTVVRDAAVSGDYDLALAAQRRREQLVALYAKFLGTAASAANVIVLKPVDARTNGTVGYDRTADALMGWKTVGSIATWEVPKIALGAYNIVVTYAAQEGSEPNRPGPLNMGPDSSGGGEFEFYEDSSLPGAEQNRRTGQVISTGGFSTWGTMNLPPIQVTRTPIRFSLRLTKARSSNGVMNLKEIRLVPPGGLASATTTPSPDGTQSGTDFARLQQIHLDRMKELVTPVVTAYSNSLKALGEKATATGDADTAEDFNVEARRSISLIEDPKTILTGPTKSPRSQINADGFRELRGATYVESSLNTGDRFRVKQNGEEFFVRLLWVSCPPAVEMTARKLKEFSDYFGTSREDTTAVGKQATEFSARFLNGVPLTLLTRGSKDAEENLLVSVRAEGLGDFAGALVDNGLAMIDAPSTKKAPSRRHEDIILQGLREREAAAKSRPIPPGAWALKSEK